MEEKIEEKKSNQNILPIAVVIAGVLIAGAVLYNNWGVMGRVQLKEDYDSQALSDQSDQEKLQKQISVLEETVMPKDGVVLPVVWGDIGAKLASVGAIDVESLVALYEQRGTFKKEYSDLFLEQNAEELKITPDNAGFLLNLFWALGLSSDNPILDSGEMANPKYGGAQRFASTAGWTMAKGDPMEHYSRHKFFNLTPEQQVLVDRVSRGIYRPCCNNSTHFPDCNHGMAMLGLLELMASQGVNEQEMWRVALAVNSYWFPDNYITIAYHMKNKGIEWKDVSPQEILGSNYSSASGYSKILAQTAPAQSQRGSTGCGVGAGAPTVISTPKSQNGCGI